jgi:hypothetical protein
VGHIPAVYRRKVHWFKYIKKYHMLRILIGKIKNRCDWKQKQSQPKVLRQMDIKDLRAELKEVKY